MYTKVVKISAYILMMYSILSASEVTGLHTFTAGTPAVAAEVNANFVSVKSAVDDNQAQITLKQNRVSGSCTAGSSINQIFDDGTVSCEIDLDTDTTYSAGSGLSMNGTTFNVDTTSVQTRVSGTCLVGSTISAINEDGSVVCAAGKDKTGIDYWVSAGGYDLLYADSAGDFNESLGYVQITIPESGELTFQYSYDMNISHTTGTTDIIVGGMFAEGNTTDPLSTATLSTFYVDSAMPTATYVGSISKVYHYPPELAAGTYIFKLYVKTTGSGLKNKMDGNIVVRFTPSTNLY